MFKLIFLSAGLLTLINTIVVQASDLNEKKHINKTVIPASAFEKPLVLAELPFIDRCKYERIKVDWKKTREVLLKSIGYGDDIFKDEVRDRLHIDYDKLEELGFQKLYEQYKDFYNNWFGLTSEQKESKKPVVSSASISRCSSSSASTISTTIDNDHDADTTYSVTAPLLRQRHPTASSSNSTIPVQ